ncbi:MAG: hypothetical protein E7372_05100 [Clostridiales bacterium]|nr:hypothetical protein [Clostridiales bacterium]
MSKFTKEQLQAVEHESGNILISASAGSGKTHTMISRLVRLVMHQNVDVNQILAVTFTEKSAIDMKEKLKSTLMKSQDGDRKRLYKQIALIPTCDISTLHAFCARLIRHYFYEVGLSPDFSVAEDALVKTMQSECVDKTFKEFYESGEDWFYTLIDRHAVSRNDSALKQLVITAYLFANSEQNPDLILDKYKSEYQKENFENLLNKYLEMLKSQVRLLYQEVLNAYTYLTNNGLEKGIAFTKMVIADMQIVLKAKDVYVVKGSFEGCSARLSFDSKLTQEQKQVKETVDSCRKKFRKIIERYNAHLSDKESDFMAIESLSKHTEHFISVVKRFAEIYDAEKRDENVLDFADLEHFALKILRNANILDEVRKKYKYVFVDEYQDINGVQESIINLIANDNLFMVGDIKQSIYGFRGCRPDFFASKFESMQKNGQKVLSLNHNFRSAKAIIDVVNQVFCYSMTKEFFESEYKGNAELVSGGVYPQDKTGRALLHVLEKEKGRDTQKESPRVYNILQEIKKEVDFKDNHTASLITEIINEELKKTYYDFKNNCDRQITYSDIAILTRNKDNSYVQGIVKGLMMHGVPVISEVKENICDYPEIQMVINVLRLVDNFSQEIPLASTLLSPIADFTNDDLAEIVCAFSHTEDAKNNKKWSFIHAYKYYLENVTNALSSRLKEFNRYIEELTFVSKFIGAQGVLNKIIDEKDIESYLFAGHNGAKKVALLDRLVWASIDGDKKLTVQEFLDKVDNSPESFAFSDSQKEDAVSFMTIHASKGLEFPVVIVCGLEQNMKLSEKKNDVIFSREHGLAFMDFDDKNRKKKETLLRAVIKEETRTNSVKEELRLLYVALTRATYSLHMIYEGEYATRKEIFAGAEKYIDYIPNSVPYSEHFISDLGFTELKSDTRKIIIGQSDEKIISDMKDRFSKKYPFELDTTLPLKLSVTKVNNDEEKSELVHLIFDEQTPDIERGNIAHKIMEHFDFDSTLDLHAQVLKMIENKILSIGQVEKVNLQRIQNAINSGAFNDVKGTKLYREKMFLTLVDAGMVLDTLSKEQVVLQGVIDLLSIANDGAIIIDYKYSSLDNESLKKQYHKQLELYAIATKKVLNLDIKKMVIVNLFTGETVEI